MATDKPNDEPLSGDELDEVTGGTNAIVPPPAPGQSAPPPGSSPPGPGPGSPGSSGPMTPSPGSPGDVG